MAPVCGARLHGPSPPEIRVHPCDIKRREQTVTFSSHSFNPMPAATRLIHVPPCFDDA
jgi:hypothetical protein